MTNNLNIKTIYCPRSGLPLAQITNLCASNWPVLANFSQTFLHPIYNVPLPALISKLSSQIICLENNCWKPESTAESTELSLSLSAIMYSLGCIVQDSRNPAPSLPAFPVSIGAASRVLHLASWYFNLTSQRLTFPQYHPNTVDKNLLWQNFSAYLDACFTIKDEWESGKKKLEAEESIRLSQEASKEIRDAKIKIKLDYIKVWAWIDTQISQSPKYPVGRRETLKTLFLRGNLEPENWIADDIDDLSEAVFDLCDQGNDITHFIRQRLNGIRDALNNFYGSFTLLGGIADSGKDSVVVSDSETKKEKEFFENFDNQLIEMTELPPAPERTQFATLGLYLKAQAQHNILSRRWALLQSKRA
jgi:hypothetical protein